MARIVTISTAILEYVSRTRVRERNCRISSLAGFARKSISRLTWNLFLCLCLSLFFPPFFSPSITRVFFFCERPNLLSVLSLSTQATNFWRAIRAFVPLPVLLIYCRLTCIPHCSAVTHAFCTISEGSLSKESITASTIVTTTTAVTKLYRNPDIS